MIYQYLPNDPARYATALRLQPASRTLVWDNANGQGSLLVQTPFGQPAQELMETLCPLLEERFPAEASSEAAAAGVTIPYPANTQEKGYTDPVTLARVGE